MDYPGRLIAGFITIILIIIFPMQYIAESFSSDMDYYVYSETKAFADDIRNKGYIDQDMYEEYINFLSRTGELYDLEIEDIHPLVGDELAGYKGSFISTDVVTNKAGLGVKNYASHSLHMHDSSLENDLIKTSTHVHTADCYVGHRHDRSCPVRYFYTGEAVNYYRELDATGWNENGNRYSIIYLRCRSCDVVLASATHSENNRGLSRTNQTVEQISFQFRYLDNNGSISQASFYIRKHFTSYEDDGSGWEWGNGIYYKLNPDWNTYLNIFNQLWGAMVLDLSAWINLGLNTAYSCWNCLSLGRIRKTLTSEYSCGQKQDETPICDRVVTAITAANPSQTVIQGNNIDTTAIAVYLDGHTGRVSTTASAYNPNLLGNQTVTLTYRGLIRNAKTTGELTCTVSVLVKAAKTLSSISVSPATQIVDRLSNPSFTVTANYSDGSKTILNSSQYRMTGYDSSKTGAQTVTFSYTEDGVTKTATATVYVNALSSITVSPAEIIVDRYTDVSLLKFTVTASYLYGSSKTISSGYVISGYQPSVLGKQTVTISYTEKGITKTTTAIVYVNGLSSITVSPTELTVQRYTAASSLKFTVTATYLYGSNKTINSGYVISGYQPSVLGNQNVTVSYTEKDITKTATVKVNVTVLKKL